MAIKIETIIQIIGFGATAAGVSAFLIKNVKKLYIMQAVSSALFVVQFFLLGGYSGSAMIIVDGLRSLALSTGKPFVKSKVFLAVILTMCVTAFFTASENLTDPITYLTLIASMLCAAAFWTGNSRVIRLAQILIVSPLWFVYSVHTNSIGGAVSQILMMIASAIYLLKEKNSNNKEMPV